MEIIGWASSILFGICAVPQAYSCWKAGHADGMSSFFLWTWLTGEALGIIYALHLGDLPILFNYLFNMMALVVIVWYRYFPRKH